MRYDTAKYTYTDPYYTYIAAALTLLWHTYQLIWTKLLNIISSKMAAMVWPCGGHNDVVATVVIIERPLGPVKDTLQEKRSMRTKSYKLLTALNHCSRNRDMLICWQWECKCKVYIVWAAVASWIDRVTLGNSDQAMMQINGEKGFPKTQKIFEHKWVENSIIQALLNKMNKKLWLQQCSPLPEGKCSNSS
jgi:hypothetical protein